MNEKFVPYKNADSQIIDPAEKKTPVVVEKIKNALSDYELKIIQDILTHPNTHYAQQFKELLFTDLPTAEKKTPVVVEKIKNALSDYELKIIQDILTQPNTHYAQQFKELLFTDLPTDED